jgi:hypothetical protein
MKIIILAFALTLLCAVSLVAQGNQTSLRGTVKDWIGAVVPRARVNIIGENSRRTVFANQDGFYAVDLPNGTYSLRYTMRGFCDEAREGITVTYPDTAVIDTTFFPCSIALTTVTERGTDRTKEYDQLRKPFEEKAFSLCLQPQSAPLIVRYGKMVETDGHKDFSGFTVQGQSDTAFPVVIVYKGQEVFADSVRLVGDKLLMTGVRWPFGGAKAAFQEMTVALCPGSATP